MCQRRILWFVKSKKQNTFKFSGHGGRHGFPGGGRESQEFNSMQMSSGTAAKLPITECKIDPISAKDGVAFI